MSVDGKQLEAESREKFLAQVEWAKEHLPREHPPFVAAAIFSVAKSLGRAPKPEEIRARLIETGRDRDSVNAQAKRHGQKEPLA